MSRHRIYIAGAGILSSLGRGCEATYEALQNNSCGLSPLRLFSLQSNAPMPAGEVNLPSPGSPLPRTHRLALEAARQAVPDPSTPLDGIIIGSTTGGILTTEELLKKGRTDQMAFQYHGLTTVARQLADHFSCSGPALTVSTACSSGAVAISIALALLRQNRASTVLVGGVDSLCRLTYFGFHSLQLVDPDGARPMDVNRKGMSVAEGAAMLLLTTKKTDSPLAEITGFGLSCDAYHPATPHPEGKGAIKAIRAALADAEIAPEDIDYINLHGTGTPDNDRAESQALMDVFKTPPPISSIKGATGHSLAAAAVIEAVVAALAVSRGIIPANTGLITPDPELLPPQKQPEKKKISAVLSNSFGFGGNNGALVISEPDHFPHPVSNPERKPLTVCGTACLTGMGDLRATLHALQKGISTAGVLDIGELSANLPARRVRRLKRLARMTLSLAFAAHTDTRREDKPTAVFMGTGWGALSETHDFLTRLEETGEQFPSPTDFIGSVHNGPAGQVALFFQATGANITCSGGDYSFEQALLAADLLAGDEPCCVIGADEAHEVFSPLLDPSTGPKNLLADGGGAFSMQRSSEANRISLKTSFYQDGTTGNVITALIRSLGGKEKIAARFSLILVGIPAVANNLAASQLREFTELTNTVAPLVDYRKFIGQFASASAVAAAIAVESFKKREIPGAFTANGHNTPLAGEILILGLGNTVTAMECGGP